MQELLLVSLTGPFSMNHRVVIGPNPSSRLTSTRRNECSGAAGCFAKRCRSLLVHVINDDGTLEAGPQAESVDDQFRSLTCWGPICVHKSMCTQKPQGNCRLGEFI